MHVKFRSWEKGVESPEIGRQELGARFEKKIELAWQSGKLGKGSGESRVGKWELNVGSWES